MDFPTKMYIDGTLRESSSKRKIINPATEKAVASIATAVSCSVSLGPLLLSIIHCRYGLRRLS